MCARFVSQEQEKSTTVISNVVTSRSCQDRSTTPTSSSPSHLSEPLVFMSCQKSVKFSGGCHEPEDCFADQRAVRKVRGDRQGVFRLVSCHAQDVAASGPGDRDRIGSVIQFPSHQASARAQDPAQGQEASGEKVSSVYFLISSEHESFSRDFSLLFLRKFRTRDLRSLSQSARLSFFVHLHVSYSVHIHGLLPYRSHP